jgi:hypothetical protein
MAFIGKKSNETGKNKKAAVTVTTNEGRIGLLVRNGVIAPGTLMDVLIGTDEDFGFLQITFGAGTPAKAFGKKGTTISYSASRAMAKTLPPLRRHTAVICEKLEDGSLIIDLGLDMVDAPEPAPVAAELGL